MAQKHRFRHENKRNRQVSAPSNSNRPAPPVYVPPPVVVYGQPKIILEDAQRQTFEFKGGAWTPFGLTIAECRRDGIVKVLPQKINGMTRYEVRCPQSP